MVVAVGNGDGDRVGVGDAVGLGDGEAAADSVGDGVGGTVGLGVLEVAIVGVGEFETGGAAHAEAHNRMQSETIRDRRTLSSLNAADASGW